MHYQQRSYAPNIPHVKRGKAFVGIFRQHEVLNSQFELPSCGAGAELERATEQYERARKIKSESAARPAVCREQRRRSFSAPDPHAPGTLTGSITLRTNPRSCRILRQAQPTVSRVMPSSAD